MIAQAFLDELLERTDLPALVGESVGLVRKGASHEGRCPFHEEKTPSFKVFRDHYRCFGCGAHGNAIGFAMARLGLQFRGAVRLLACRAGMAVEEEGGAAPRAARPGPHQEAYRALDRACAEYQRLLATTPGNPALAELQRRGIDLDVAMRYGLGFSPGQWGTLSRNKGFPEKALVEAGLSVSRPDGKGCYDRFRLRLMFPIADALGRTIGFGGRRLGEDGPKYLNSPETPLYRKGALLFGAGQARAAVARENHVVVVEGYFDVITPASHGVENIVSTCGTALTGSQAEALLAMADRVTLCFDGDAAGNRATWAAASLLVPRVNDGHEVRLCRLPDGHDPDSLVREQGIGALAASLAAAPTLVDYLAGEIARGARSAEARARALLAALAQWRNFAAPAMQVFFRQALCDALRLTPAEFDRLAAQNSPREGDAALRHCPCCRSGAQFRDEADGHRAACESCGISTPPLPTREQAQAVWNRRDRIRHAA